MWVLDGSCAASSRVESSRGQGRCLQQQAASLTTDRPADARSSCQPITVAAAVPLAVVPQRPSPVSRGPLQPSRDNITLPSTRPVHAQTGRHSCVLVSAIAFVLRSPPLVCPLHLVPELVCSSLSQLRRPRGSSLAALSSRRLACALSHRVPSLSCPSFIVLGPPPQLLVSSRCIVLL